VLHRYYREVGRKLVTMSAMKKKGEERPKWKPRSVWEEITSSCKIIQSMVKSRQKSPITARVPRSPSRQSQLLEAVTSAFGFTVLLERQSGRDRVIC
jgi:hypothetical protein